MEGWGGWDRAWWQNQLVGGDAHFPAWGNEPVSQGGTAHCISGSVHESLRWQKGRLWFMRRKPHMIWVRSRSSREGLYFHGPLFFGLLFGSVGPLLAEFCQSWFPPVDVLRWDGNSVVWSMSRLPLTPPASFHSLPYSVAMVGFVFHCKGPVGLSLTLIFNPWTWMEQLRTVFSILWIE